jgi:hypothetical protein
MMLSNAEHLMLLLGRVRILGDDRGRGGCKGLLGRCAH